MPNETSDFSLTLPPGYRDREVLAFLARDPEALAERVSPPLIRKGCVIDGTPVVIDIERQGPQVRWRADADGSLSGAGSALLHQAVTGMLGLRLAPEPFEYAVRNDALLGPVVRRQTGLRLPQTATAFEALTWAIIGQQITIAFAVTLRRRLILMADRRHSSGHWCYPDAAAVAGLSVEALVQRQFSRAKAETLVRVAQLVARGELPLDVWQQSLPADAGDTLLAIRGIGPWTVNYTLLRGFAEPDRSLHGDAAVATALHRLTGSPAKPNPKQVQGILERYQPHRSLVAAHLWASLHLSA